MQATIDPRYDLYTRESVLKALRKYAQDISPETDIKPLERLLDAYYEGSQPECVEAAFGDIENADILKVLRKWIQAGLARKEPTSLRVTGEWLGTADTSVRYAPDVAAIRKEISQYREITDEELIYIFSWKKAAGIPSDILKKGIRRGMKVNPGMSLDELMVFCGDDKTDEEIRTKEERYKLATRIATSFGMDRYPNTYELGLLDYWLDELGFKKEDILFYCDRMIETPTFQYLNGILENQSQLRKALANDDIRHIEELSEGVREVNRRLGYKNKLDVNSIIWFNTLREQYKQEIILLAAEECARNGQIRRRDVERLLEKWRNHNLLTKEQISEHLRDGEEVREYIERLAESMEISSGELHAGKAEQGVIRGWLKKKYDEELIAYVAMLSAKAEKPIRYMDKILRSYAEKGISTKAEAIKNTEEYIQILKANNSQGKEEKKKVWQLTDDTLEKLKRYHEADALENSMADAVKAHIKRLEEDGLSREDAMDLGLLYAKKKIQDEGMLERVIERIRGEEKNEPPT